MLMLMGARGQPSGLCAVSLFSDGQRAKALQVPQEDGKGAGCCF